MTRTGTMIVTGTGPGITMTVTGMAIVAETETGTEAEMTMSDLAGVIETGGELDGSRGLHFHPCSTLPH